MVSMGGLFPGSLAPSHLSVTRTQINIILVVKKKLYYFGLFCALIARKHDGNKKKATDPRRCSCVRILVWAESSVMLGFYVVTGGGCTLL